MERIQEIVAAIMALQPEEKQHLFRLLDEQGELPAAAANDPAAGSLPKASSPRSRSVRPRDYIVVFDGGSKGNPGWGYGSYAITRVQDGAQRLERLDFGQGYTNNEAEYDSLLAALQDLDHRITEAGRQPGEFALEIRGDSSLVIKQLQGRWKAKDPRMKERRDRCRELLERFAHVDLKTQPREESVRILGH